MGYSPLVTKTQVSDPEPSGPLVYLKGLAPNGKKNSCKYGNKLKHICSCVHHGSICDFL